MLLQQPVLTVPALSWPHPAGAVLVAGKSKVTLEDSQMTNNTAPGGFGGVIQATDNAQLLLNNTVILHSEAM